MTLVVSSISQIHFGFGFIVNSDPDSIIESPLSVPAVMVIEPTVSQNLLFFMVAL